MSDLFGWLKEHFMIKLKSTIATTNPFTPTTQEDPRTIQSIKNTRAAFKQQEAAMNIRALKAHAAECDDPWTCTKDKCFVVEPDKIVHTEKASEEEIKRFKKVQEKNNIIKDKMWDLLNSDIDKAVEKRRKRNMKTYREVKKLWMKK